MTGIVTQPGYVRDPLSASQRAANLACRRDHRACWVVVQRNGNASAFNGYRWQWSAYSCVRCTDCGRRWRTKAGYVRNLPGEPS